MPASNDTPVKRLKAAVVVVGIFLIFGIVALVLGLNSPNPDEPTAADEAGAERRLAVREEVDAAQAGLLSRVDLGEGKVQVPPSEVFSLVGTQLVASQPKPFENDSFKAPQAATKEEPVTTSEPQN